MNRGLHRYELKNKHLTLAFYNVGGAIDYLSYNDSHNLLLSYDDKKNYLNNQELYLNCLIGPNAGRVAEGKMQEYQLTINNGINHLHGGNKGISNSFFDVEIVNEQHAILRLSQSQEEDGYPSGIFEYRVDYELIDNYLQISYELIPPKPCYVNMTSHLYFNLNEDYQDITNHQLGNDFEKRVLVDKDMIPKQIIDNEFKNINLINDLLEVDNEQIHNGNGVDFPFILDDKGLILFNDQYEIKVTSTSDSCVVYTGNFITDDYSFNGNHLGKKYLGVALEAQKIPNYFNIDKKADLYDENHPFKQVNKYIIKEV